VREACRKIAENKCPKLMTIGKYAGSNGQIDPNQ